MIPDIILINALFLIVKVISSIILISFILYIYIYIYIYIYYFVSISIAIEFFTSAVAVLFTWENSVSLLLLKKLIHMKNFYYRLYCIVAVMPPLYCQFPFLPPGVLAILL